MLPKGFQEPLGHTMGLQDSDKSSPRDHQESLGDLQERSKSSLEAAKSAPEGLKKPPRAIQIVDRSPQGCQDSSKAPKSPPRGLQEAIWTPEKASKT